MRHLLHLELSPSVTSSVRDARVAVDAAAARAGFDSERRHDIVLAAGEACANAVTHAYRGVGERPYTVDVTYEDGTLTVTVADRGAGMRPASERHGLGLGLPLMATLSDDLTIGPVAGGGTRVVLGFDRSVPGGTG